MKHWSLWGVVACALCLTPGLARAAAPTVTFEDPQIGGAVRQIELDGPLTTLRFTVVTGAEDMRAIRDAINRQSRQLVDNRMTLFIDEWKCQEEDGVATCRASFQLQAREGHTFDLKIGERTHRFRMRAPKRQRIDSPQRLLQRGAQRVKVVKREACAAAVAEDLRLPARAERVTFSSRYGAATGWLACDTGEVLALSFDGGRNKALRYVVMPQGQVHVAYRVNDRWRELCARGTCRDERAHKNDTRTWSRGWSGKGDKLMDAQAAILLAAYRDAARPKAPAAAKGKGKARASR